MKKLLCIAITIVLFFTFFGCAKETTELDYVNIIQNCCGHRSEKTGHEYSYDIVLKVMYSKYNVKWKQFEYKELINTKYSKLNLSTGEREEYPLKKEYEYALCTIKENDDTETNLIFVYDKTKNNVICCVGENPYDNSYMENWDIYEPLFCHYYCECKK